MARQKNERIEWRFGWRWWRLGVIQGFCIQWNLIDWSVFWTEPTSRKIEEMSWNNWNLSCGLRFLGYRSNPREFEDYQRGWNPKIQRNQYAFRDRPRSVIYAHNPPNHLFHQFLSQATPTTTTQPNAVTALTNQCDMRSDIKFIITILIWIKCDIAERQLRSSLFRIRSITRATNGLVCCCSFARNFRNHR